MPQATLQSQAIALQHSQIIETARAIAPEYVTSEFLVSNPTQPSMCFAVLAINEAGTYKHFNVRVPLATAYRPQTAAQKAISDRYERGWQVLTALTTGDTF